MGKTLREKAILAMVGVIALYAFAVILWFASAESSWKKAAKLSARLWSGRKAPATTACGMN